MNKRTQEMPNAQISIRLVTAIIILIGTIVKAQPQDTKTYMNEEYYVEVSKKPIQAIRYLDKNSKPVSTYYTLQSPHVLSSKGAQQLLSLPPDNRAVYYQKVEIPPNVKYNIGQVAEGVWIKERGQTKWSFKPIQDINIKAIERIRSGGGEVHYREGGYVQIEINVKDIPKIKPLGGREEMPSSNYENLRQGNVRHDVNTSKSQESIRSVINKFGDMPGGILISSKGIIRDGIYSVKYDHSKNEFIINGSYSYLPELDFEEVATIANVIYKTSDRTLAALNQQEFVGVPDNCKIAMTLSEGDILLGQIAYGYDVKGRSLTMDSQIKGYKNPLQQILQDFRNQDMKKISRAAMIELSGVEPRLFLEFKSVYFEFDHIQKVFSPVEVKIDVAYQTFRYNEKNDKNELIFTEKEPEFYHPHIVAAIHHIKNNFASYESTHRIFLKIRKIAEVYAFLEYLQGKNISLAGKNHLEDAYQNRIKFPVFYDFYTNILPDSDLKKFYKDAVTLLENIETSGLSSKEELSVYTLLTKYSINNNQLAKAKLYREKALNTSKQVLERDKTSSDFKVDLDKARLYLRLVIIPDDISAKVSMSKKYKDKNKKIATNFHNQAMSWLSDAVEQGHDIYHEYIAFFCHDFGDYEKAKIHLQKAIDKQPNNQGLKDLYNKWFK